MLSPPRTVAMVGKGGCGKTLLTALLTAELARQGGRHLLAVDADSSVNLPFALGLEPQDTVAGIRQRLIDDPAARAAAEDRHIREVVREAVLKGPGYYLLVMGRAEGPGCYCTLNDLLRYGIERLSQEYDLTLIDCEAGPEQINRRVVSGVDRLIVLCDPTVRSVRVAQAIVEVTGLDPALRPAQVGLVINRWDGEATALGQLAERAHLEILGRLPEDPQVRRFDAEGQSLALLPRTAPAVVAARQLLRRVIAST